MEGVAPDRGGSVDSAGDEWDDAPRAGGARASNCDAQGPGQCGRRHPLAQSRLPERLLGERWLGASLAGSDLCRPHLRPSGRSGRGPSARDCRGREQRRPQHACRMLSARPSGRCRTAGGVAGISDLKTEDQERPPALEHFHHCRDFQAHPINAVVVREAGPGRWARRAKGLADKCLRATGLAAVGGR
jgi:hypothetical protein